MSVGTGQVARPYGRAALTCWVDLTTGLRPVLFKAEPAIRRAGPGSFPLHWRPEAAPFRTLPSSLALLRTSGMTSASSTATGPSCRNGSRQNRAAPEFLPCSSGAVAENQEARARGWKAPGVDEARHLFVFGWGRDLSGRQRFRRSDHGMAIATSPAERRHSRERV